MPRKTGYLASLLHVPPLVFRFQYNPALLAEKKTFQYTPATAFGTWEMPGLGGATGLLSGAVGLYEDLKGFGPLLVQTKPLEAGEGEPRTVGLEFQLDADNPGPLDGGDHYGGSIAPDLALLRSFMSPSLDYLALAAVAQLAGGGSAGASWKRPPEVSLLYGGLSLTCVMTDLHIKMVAFHDDGEPARADVSVTLKEQTNSLSPMAEGLARQVQVGRSLFRHGIGWDLFRSLPLPGFVLSPIENAFT